MEALEFLRKDAIFSDDRKYRYLLTRVWDSEVAVLNSIGLNPSNANEYIDDPTITREIYFAKLFGYGGLYKYNLFGYISSDPEQLRNPDIDPIRDNDIYLQEIYGDVVICWGSWNKIPEVRMRADKVRSMLKPPIYCFGRNQDGEPKHPLYLPKTTKLEIYN